MLFRTLQLLVVLLVLATPLSAQFSLSPTVGLAPGTDNWSASGIMFGLKGVVPLRNDRLFIGGQILVMPSYTRRETYRSNTTYLQDEKLTVFSASALLEYILANWKVQPVAGAALGIYSADFTSNTVPASASAKLEASTLTVNTGLNLYLAMRVPFSQRLALDVRGGFHFFGRKQVFANSSGKLETVPELSASLRYTFRKGA